MDDEQLLEIFKTANADAPMAARTTELLKFGRAAILAEREACAAECDRLTWAIDCGGNKYRRPAGADKCATAIRMRSNAKVSGAGTASAGLPGSAAG